MNLQKLLLFLPVFFLNFLFTPLLSQCPTIEAIMVNGCAPNESDGEFMIINSGGSGFDVSDLTIDFYSNTTGVNDDIGPGEDCQFMSPPLNADLTGCPNFIEVGPGDNIPANSIIVVMTSTGGDASEYDWTPLCGSGETVYLLQNSCDRTAGAFKDNNAPGEDRTTTISLPGGCTNELTYEPDLNSGTDGDYVLPCTPSPTCPDGVEYGNNGCVVPPVTVPCTPNDIDAVSSVTECDSYTLPAITGSPLSGGEAYYTGSNGTGTQYMAGDMITSSSTLFIFDAASGCSEEESFSVTINTTPTAIPPTSDIHVCITILPPALVSDNISVVENEITGGDGSLTVNWWLDAAGTNDIDINNPFDLLSLIPPPTTIYATVTSSEGCESTTVAVIGNGEVQPSANTASASECDDGSGMATFDLTALEGTIGGANSVTFYTDAGAANMIPNPDSYQSASATIFATANTVNGCNSEPVAITLTVLPALDVTISVSPFDACGNTDVDVSFTVSGPDMYDFTLQYGNATSGYTDQNINTGDGGTITIAITETSEFLITSASDPGSGCPFTIPATPEIVTITTAPDISTIMDVISCGNYTLPAIPYNSGATGSGAYYTGPNGTGASFNPGDVINSTTQLFAFDGMAPGCFDEESFMVTITSPPDLQVNGPSQICAGEGFELSSIVNDISGSGIPVTYHSNTPPTAGNELPSSFVVPASTTSYYAFADGGSGCQSTLEITVTVFPLPTANTASLSLCDEGGSSAFFDLTSLSNTVNGGSGMNVDWYLDMNLNTPINNPTGFSSSSTTLYASVDDGTCSSEGAEITLTVLPAPTTNPAGPLEGCDNGSGQAIFDLTQLDNTINGGNGNTVSWFTDAGLNSPIGTPSSFLSGATTVFTSVSDGTCDSPSQGVSLVINSAPTAFDYQIDACGTPNATFDLTSFSVTNAVTGGTGTPVNWYTNSAGTTPLNMPSNIVTPITTIVYATTESNGCESEASEVTLMVTQAPSATPASLTACDDGSGQATFDLTSLNNAVNGGSGLIVNYYTDSGAGSVINIPNTFVSGPTTVYAQIEDSNCFSEIVEITLTTQQINLNCSEFSPVSTVGGSNGQASIDISGGTSPYTINWDGPATGSQISSTDGQVIIDNLLAGNYSLTVTDDNDCTANCSFTITDPNCNLSLDISGEDPDCNGNATGNILLTINNGTPNFTIVWNDNSLDGIEDPINLLGGDYMVTVTDSEDCTATASYTLTAPSALMLTCSEQTSVSVSGGNDGVASIDFSGGTAPFTLSWSGPVSGNQNEPIEGNISISDLSAGDYSITLTDANDCTTSCDFSISEAGCNLTLEIMGIDPLCANEAEGIIDLTINGGNSPFTIDWSVDSLDGFEDLTEMLAGSYDVTVTDGNDCTANISVTLTAPDALMLTCGEQSPVSAIGADDGVASIDFSGGTAPYVINWTGPSTGSQNEPVAGSTTISDLPAGNYSVTITDANDCTTICSFNINDAGCSLVLQLTTFDETCSGSNDGQVELIIFNGNMPFTIDWSDDSLDGILEPMNLAAGSYSLTVTDMDNCQATTTLDIGTQFPAPTASLSSGGSICEGDCYDFDLSFSGVAPFVINYSLDDGNSNASFSFTTSSTDTTIQVCPVDLSFTGDTITFLLEDISDANCSISVDLTDSIKILQTTTGDYVDQLCPGDSVVINGNTYNIDTPSGMETLLAANSNGCDSIVTIDISFFDIPEFDLIDTLCFGDTLVVNGTAYHENMTSGTEVLAGQSSDGCDSLINVTLTLLPEVTASISGDSNICLGNSTALTFNFSEAGTFTVEYFGENGTLETLNDIVDGHTININPIVSTVYTISSILPADTNCPVTIGEGATINVSQLEAQIIIDQDILCNGEQDGILTATPSMGITPYTYAWSTLDTVSQVSGLLAGTYTVTISDDYNCELILSEILTDPEALLLSCGALSEVSTPSGNDGEASIDFSGGTAPYVLSWTGPVSGNQNETTAGNTTISNLMAGDYTVTLTDANNCETTCDFTITESACLMTLQITGTDETCPGESNGLIEMVVLDGIEPITYDWSDDTYDGIEEPMDLAPGLYSVTITDANDCEAIASVTIGTQFETPTVNISAGGAICEGSCYDFDLSFSGTPPFTINYSLNDGNTSPSFSVTSFSADTTIQICPADLNLTGNNVAFALEDLSDANCFATIGITENIEILSSTIADYQEELCPDESVIINGNVYDFDTPSGIEILSGVNENGCDSIVSINLTFFDIPEFDLTQTLCEGESIIVNGTTYDEDMPSGTETLIGQSSNGCDSIVHIDLNFIPVLTASLTGGANICSGESATLTFNYSGAGVFSAQYVGENGVSELLNNISDGHTIEVSPSGSTSYAIEFIIATGTNCPILITNNATINVSQLQTQINIEQEILCGGTADGILSVAANGGITPYAYSWNTGSANNQITGAGPGVYTVDVIDAAGCSVESSINFTAPNAIQIWFETTGPDCFDNQSGSITIDSIKGGDGNFEYSFDGEFYQPLAGLPAQFGGLEPGQQILYIQDEKDCIVETDVFIPEVAELTIDLGEDILIELGESANLNGLVNFSVDSLVWSPTDSLFTPTALSTDANPTISTTYSLTAWDEKGCFTSDDIRIIVNRDVPVFIPTVFSPNDDGVNDILMIFGGKGVVQVNDFIIFDRWGNAVYEAKGFPVNDPNFGWNGKYRGQSMKPAVFVYFAEVLFADGRTEQFKGDFTLVR
jgi:gliding motility-associated-like protein